MAVAYVYSNVSVANTIGNNGGISSSATSLQATTTPSGYPGSFPFKLRLDPGTSKEEVVKVTGGSGTGASPWTVVRGWDGTTAQAHSQGAGLAHGMTQEDLALSRTHENSGSGSGVHGLPASAWAQSSIALIASQVMPNSSSTIVTFGSIPQSYTHLIVMVQGRLSATSGQFGDIGITVNGDTGSHYSGLTFDAQTTTGTLVGPVANTYSAQSAWQWTIILAASQAGSGVNAGGGWMLLPNYAASTFNKQFISQSGFGNGTNSAMAARLRWGWWNPGTQVGINTLSLAANIGAYNSGSAFYLYGLS